MKRTHVLMGRLAVGAASAALLLAALPAAAGECRLACAIAKGVCSNVVATAFRACKVECAGAASILECRLACRDNFGIARVACKTALTECRDRCPIEDPCVRACGVDAVTCARPVKVAAKTCARACFTAAGEAAAACPPLPGGRECLLAVGAELARCLRGCGGEALADVAACLVDLRACIGVCRASPSGAFLDLRADCLR